MLKRRHLIIVAAMLLGVALTAFFWPHEPFHQGHSLSFLLERLGRDYSTNYGPAALTKAHLAPLSDTNEAVVAVRAIGAAALPHLLKRLQAGESRWDLWRRTFNKAQSVLHLEVDRVEHRRAEGQIGLIALGDLAKPAIPKLMQSMTEWRSPEYRPWDSAVVLRNLGADGVIALTNAFTNRGDFAWAVAAEALRFQGTIWGDPSDDPRIAKYRTERISALPHLAGVAQRTNYIVVPYALMALCDIGGRSAIVTNTLNDIIADRSTNLKTHQAAREAARGMLRRLAATNRISTEWRSPGNF